MGAACCSDAKQAVETVTEDIDQHGIKAKIEGKAAEVADAAKDAAEKVQETSAQVAKDSDEKGIVIVAHDAAQSAQAAAKDATEAVESAAASAVDAAKVAAKDATEAANATMDAAVAAVTGVMIVEFVNEKGTIQKVDFKTKKIGITFGLGGGGCCGPTGPAKVVVKSVGKASQAETLGVKSKWSIKAVNGVEVTGFSRAEKMLKEGAAKLSDA
mmetsp:Transcript_1674/g.4943  ORF Transcript_1674/g.4943 Transcript_1674/m.4943 type:complete len:214 (-) Transcript_1674:158-799(-)